jgi:uncharacterized small protein (DUF1192 family)
VSLAAALSAQTGDRLFTDAAATARFWQAVMAEDNKGSTMVKEVAPANRLVAEAQLTVAEVQELGERIGAIKKLLARVKCRPSLYQRWSPNVYRGSSANVYQANYPTPYVQ